MVVQSSGRGATWKTGFGTRHVNKARENKMHKTTIQNKNVAIESNKYKKLYSCNNNNGIIKLTFKDYFTVSTFTAMYVRLDVDYFIFFRAFSHKMSVLRNNT